MNLESNDSETWKILSAGEIKGTKMENPLDPNLQLGILKGTAEVVDVLTIAFQNSSQFYQIGMKQM